ncbi:hypothetical protein J1614_009491 [Plenodomus biglobosus]|nr:hypothetical protein J1614_009491 [Plenodomus biglobosus]
MIRVPFESTPWDLRLDILLHECVHALICQFACKACESYDVNAQNAEGHGRAFQVLSGAVFEGARELLGIGEFAPSFTAAFLAHWDDVRYLPSVHDMETWPDYKKVGHVVQGRRYRKVLFFDGKKSPEEIRHQIGACVDTDFGGTVVLKRGTPLLPIGTCHPVLDMGSVIFPVLVLGGWLMLYVALLYLLWILIETS